MKISSYSELFRSLFVTLFVGAFLTVIFLPAYAQEDNQEGELSPAEETQQDAVSSSSVKPALWRNVKSNQLYANFAVKFYLDSTDDLSKTDYIEYKLDEGEYVRYSAPFSIYEEGPHSISYRAVDRAGNREFNQSFSVIVDNKAPEVELAPSQSFVEKDGRLFTSLNNTFTIRAVDRYSGIKSISYSINSEPIQTYKAGSVIKLSQSGSQVIKYKADDNLGNTTESGSVVVEVDNGVPIVQIRPSSSLKQVNGDRYARRSTSFNVIAKDDGAGVSQVMVRIDGAQEWQSYVSPLSFETEADHSIAAKAIDAVGNESQIAIIRFKVDDNPPVTKIRTSTGGAAQE